MGQRSVLGQGQVLGSECFRRHPLQVLALELECPRLKVWVKVRVRV